MGILKQLDSLTSRNAPIENTDGSFGRGLRSGMTSAGAGLNALAGNVGEVLGADEFAANRYEAAHAGAQQAALQAPEVTDWRDVTNAPDLSTGLRKAGSYVAGLAGQSVPYMAAGAAGAAAGALTGGAALLPVAGGMIAATAPLTTGANTLDTIQDPEAMKKSAGERLMTNTVTGVGQAALESALPGMVGAKIIGTGLKQGLRGGLAGQVGKGMAQGSLVEGGTETLGTAMNQAGQSSLNPNRDTSGDRKELIDAFVGGAALGAPIGGIGGGADYVHGMKNAAPAPAEAPAAAAEKAVPVPIAEHPAAKKLAEMAGDGFDPASVKGNPALEGAAGEVDSFMKVEAGGRLKLAREWAKEIMSNDAVPEAVRNQVGDAAKDIRSPAAQKLIAMTRKLADSGANWDSLGAKAKETAKTLNDFFASRRDPESEAAQTMAAGRDLDFDPDVAETAPPEVQQAMAEKSDATMMEKANSYLRELRNDATLSPENRAKVEQLGADIKDRTNQIGLAGIHVAQKGIKSATDTVTKFTEHVSTKYAKKDTAEAKSEVNPAIRDVITETVVPFLKEHNPNLLANPDAMNRQADALRTVMTAASEGDIDETTIDYLRNVYGGAAPRIMMAVRDAVRDSFSPEQDIALLKQIDKIGEAQNVGAEQAKFLESQIGDENMGKYDFTRRELEDLGRLIESHVDESAYADVGAEERAVRQRLFSEDMQQYFGENAEAVMASYAKRVKEKLKPSKMEERGVMEDDDSRGMDQGDIDGMVNNPESGIAEVSADDVLGKPRYYGQANNKELTLNPNSYKELYGRDHPSMDRARSENPDLSTDFVSVADLDPKEHGPVIDATRAKVEARRAAAEKKHTETYEKDTAARADKIYNDLVAKAEKNVNNGKALSDKKQTELRAEADQIARSMLPMAEFKPTPDLDIANYGFVSAQGMKQESAIDDTTFEKLKVTGTTERAGAAKIETTEHAVDAVRMVRHMLKGGMDKRTTEESSNERMLRAFDEGIAALASRQSAMPKFDEATLIVTYRGDKPLTVAELRAEVARDAAPKFDAEDKSEAGVKKRLAAMSNAEIYAVEQDMDARYEDRRAAVVEYLKSTLKRRFTGADIREVLSSPQHATFMKNHQMVKDEAFLRHSEHELREGNTDHSDLLNGAMEADPAGPLATAKAVLGEKGIERRTDAQGNSLQYARPGATGPDADYAKFNERMAKLEKASAAGRQIHDKVRELETLLEAKVPANVKTEITQILQRVITATNVNRLTEPVNTAYDRYKGLLDRLAQEDASMWGDSLGKLDAATAYSKQIAAGREITAAQKQEVGKFIGKVLGPQAQVAFGKMMHAGDYKRDMGVDLVRVSVYSTDPMSVAYHEALHGFFQHLRDMKLPEVQQVLTKAANSPYVMRRLRELLKNEPAALAQIESSAEERVAYMYQFSQMKDAAGKPLINLADGSKGIFAKIREFFANLAGVWANDQRAVHIMDYFHSGEFARTGMNDRSAVHAATMKVGTSGLFESVKSRLAPLADVAEKVVGSGSAVLRGMNVPAITEISERIAPRTTSSLTASKDVGFISAQRVTYTDTMNRFLSNIAPDATQADIDAALEALQTESTDLSGLSLNARNVVHAARRTLRESLNYMREHGVQVKDLGKEYFPVVWDLDYITKNQKEFLGMLDKYKRNGDLTGDPKQILEKLIAYGGNEFGGIETVMPGMQHIKERVLDFITPEDRAQFLEKDLFRTMHSYVQQAARRAEWAKRFGADGKELGKLMKQAERDGATPKQMETVQEYIKGVDGTLGDDISPGLRRLFGNMTVYQNVRLLPLAVFSMAVDPMGIMVRGGKLSDAYAAMKRGITEIPRSYKKTFKVDSWYKVAEDLAVIETDALIHTLGTSYSQGMVGNTGRKINDLFFRYNMVEQMNRSMRVAAVPAALKFMGRHADGTASHHSARWLAELGFVSGEVQTKNGEVLYTKQQFIDNGMSDADAANMAARMKLAINRWVDGAVLRPNATDKPIWMNDPHWVLVAHLKQFMYSFNETILKRVLNEVRHGNYTPAYALAGYVPVMIFADLIKGMALNGGDEPEYMRNWTMADHVGHGMQRAGLFGVGQFGLDAMTDMQRGGSGLGAVLGPTVEQFSDTIGRLGSGQGERAILESLPAKALLKAGFGDMQNLGNLARAH